MLKTVSSVINAIGALNYKGTWNAATNTPTLTSGVGTKGDYYVVSVAGGTNLDGITTWGVGDWAVFNGTVWQKADGGSTADVTTLTVTGLTGYMYANNTSPVTASLTIPNAGLANSTATLGNTTITLGSTTTSVGNLTLTNATISSLSAPLTVAQGGTGLTTLNSGAVLVGNTAGTIINSTSLFYDATNVRFGITTASPLATFDIGQSILMANAGAFTSADPAVQFIRTDGTGVAPFNNAGSMVYRTRVTSTAGRSSHIWYTGSPTAERMRIDETGCVTKPTQPAFNAYLSTNQANVTGDGTVYTIIFDTELFDQGSNYNNATGTFTAPVAGKYQFNFTVDLIATTATGGIINLVTTGRTYRLVAVKPSVVGTAGGDTCLSGSIIVSMAANDTATVTAMASGTTKISAVYGTSSPSVTSFSGFLVC